VICEVQKRGFSAAEIGDMNDDQLLFWYSNGRSVRMPQAKPPKGIAWNKALTPAENFARFKAANEKWKAEHGKDR
jgi:hypothetical protein